jgi:heme/copper-type cytochrome/quinol oxidase subunit 2
MRSRRALFLAIGILMLFLLASTTVGAADLKRSDEISYDDHDYISLGSGLNERQIDVTVTANATIDVYVLTSTQYSFGTQYPDNFTPTVAKEKLKSITFTFTASAQEEYYLIIDNLDNGRSTDAVPTGEVHYDATYSNPFEDLSDDIGESAFWCGMTILAIVIIVVVVIIVIVWFFSKKKPKQGTPAQQTPSPQPSQQQPPPLSPYEPPPPSPYEPPPPQPPPPY